jgi:hypothetical protein
MTMTDRHIVFGSLLVIVLGVVGILLFEVWQRRRRR